MQVLIRVDASLQIGTGHVMRCLTLAQALHENGANVQFICRQHKGNLIEKIRSNGFKVYELELPYVAGEIEGKLQHSHWLGVTQQEDAVACVDILEAKEVSWLVVDHYALDKDWQLSLEPHCKKMMVIDDLADREHQCNVLLDQTFNRHKEDYLGLVPKGCKLLLGPQYALLRPEFFKLRDYSLKRRIRPDFKQLLVNMGGLDIDNVTGQVLDALKDYCLSSSKKVVVILGKESPHLQIIMSKAKDLPYEVEIKVDVDNMAEMMANSDIAIGASGSSTWERCCLGLPTIQMVIAKNQEFSAQKLSINGVVKLITKTKEISNLLESASDWMPDLIKLSAQVCDGMGAYKVVRSLKEGLDGNS